MSPSQLSSLTTNAKVVVHHNLSPCHYPLIFFHYVKSHYLLTYLMLVSFILLTTLSPVHEQCVAYMGTQQTLAQLIKEGAGGNSRLAQVVKAHGAVLITPRF